MGYLSMTVVAVAVAGISGACVTNKINIPANGLTADHFGNPLCGTQDNKIEGIKVKSTSFTVDFPAPLDSNLQLSVGVVRIPVGVYNDCTPAGESYYMGGSVLCPPGQPCKKEGGGDLALGGFKAILAVVIVGEGPGNPCNGCYATKAQICKGCTRIKAGLCAGCWAADNTTDPVTPAALPACADSCWKPWTIPGPGTLTYTNCDTPFVPFPPTPGPPPSPAAPTPAPATPTPGGGDTCLGTPCADAGLTGHCCPTTSGTFLACCGHSAACSANPACAAEGIEGDCCPTKTGTNLACCAASSPTPAPAPGPTPDQCDVCTTGQCAACKACTGSQTGPCAPCWAKQPDGTACIPDCLPCWATGMGNTSRWN